LQIPAGRIIIVDLSTLTKRNNRAGSGRLGHSGGSAAHDRFFGRAGGMRTAFFVSVVCLAAPSATPTFGANGPNAPAAASDDDSAYTKVLEKRAADVLDVLGLDDPAKAARVREAVVNQYRGLRKLHDARDAAIQAFKGRSDQDKSELAGRIEAERARTDAAASALNDRFLAALSAELSPEQVEKVKDKMTYNKLRVTYDAYLDMLPDLTPAQKQVVFGMLKEARDKATYAGSAEEKSEVFNKSKGRVNNYLSAQGYDLKLAQKRWAERRKQAK
jgi:hypothetical protein